MVFTYRGVLFPVNKVVVSRPVYCYIPSINFFGGEGVCLLKVRESAQVVTRHSLSRILHDNIYWPKAKASEKSANPNPATQPMYSREETSVRKRPVRPVHGSAQTA